jgi:hypothetical protein
VGGAGKTVGVERTKAALGEVAVRMAGARIDTTVLVLPVRIALTGTIDIPKRIADTSIALNCRRTTTANASPMTGAGIYLTGVPRVVGIAHTKSITVK